MFIHLIVGARPNFVKISPIINAIEAYNSIEKKIFYKIIHTGQHFDKSMSESFFKELDIPSPDINLEAGGGNSNEQAANIMLRYDAFLKDNKTDICLVVGDVTSTMACAIVAKKHNIKVAHVEAGIRSFDMTMPEEINRLVTDSITDYFFTTSKFANYNLLNNGTKQENIFFVGNTMIDTLLKFKENFKKPQIWDSAKLEKYNYLIVTLHRPSNVDNENIFFDYIEKIVESSFNIPIIFPIHPRTANTLKKIKYKYTNLFFLEPLPYLEFNYLVQYSKAVITDSGGITEETTVLGIPCITLRDNTERPETVEIGTNVLLGTNPKLLNGEIDKIFKGKWKKGSIPDMWDGKTSTRIINTLLTIFNESSSH